MKRILLLGLLLCAAPSYATVVQQPTPLTCTSSGLGQTVNCPAASYKVAAGLYKAVDVTFSNKPEFAQVSKWCASSSETKTKDDSLCTLRLSYTPQQYDKTVSTSVTLKVKKCHTINGGGYNCDSTNTLYTFTITGAPVQPPGEWDVGQFGACEGGTGSWEYGDWLPSEGCGRVQQTRTPICSVVADSGFQTRSVVCKSTTGEILPDASCSGAKPATTQACTPGPEICGAAPPTMTQSVFLRSSCQLCEPDPENGIFCLMLPF